MNVTTFVFVIILSLVGGSSHIVNAQNTVIVSKNQAAKYKEIEWTDLMPKDDLDALLNPPDSVLGIEDGSEFDNFDSLSEPDMTDEASRRYFAALKSVEVVDAFDKKAVRVPGFVVPLVSDEKNQVTEFFIVPYFGACLHMPPPPPNQILYAKLEKGFELETLYAPFWFEGKLNIETKQHELGSAAYRLDVDSLYVFEE